MEYEKKKRFRLEFYLSASFADTIIPVEISIPFEIQSAIYCKCMEFGILNGLSI